MQARRNDWQVLSAVAVFCALGTLLGACTPGETTVPSPAPSLAPSAAVLPTVTASPSPFPTASSTPRPSATPTPLPSPDLWPTSYPLIGWSSPTPLPTSTAQGEIAAALEEFHRVRATAEETLNPELLAQVCVDPYLSWKIARIQENIRDGSHWETPSAHFTVTSFLQPAADTAVVRVEKRETKLFYPKGSSVPDDEICGAAIYSYRDCSYEIEYRMVQRGGRWYVSEATVLGDWPTRCRLPAVTFPPAAVAPVGWPALPADLYFLRQGRLWRWPAGGAGLQGLTAAGREAVRDYALSPDGRYIAYTTASGSLYVLEAAGGNPIFLPAAADPPAVREYVLWAQGRLLYVTAAGELHVADLAAGVPILPPAGEEAAVIGRYNLAGEGRYLAYETTEGELYVVDLVGGRPSPVPVSGTLGQFELSEGGTLFYLSKRSAGAIYDATLYAVDIHSPERPIELGACGIKGRWGCRGFWIAPDGQQVLWQDGTGLWLSSPSQGAPRLLLAIDYRAPDEGGPFCNICQVARWMPQGRGAVVDICCYEGGGLSILDTETGALWSGGRRALAWCYVDCHIETAWSAEGLWVSDIPSELMLLRLSSAGQWEAAAMLSLSLDSLWPTALQPLPGGRLAFAHQRCIPESGGVSGPPPALYILEADGRLRQVSPLPGFPCSGPADFVGQDIYRGRAVWSADGAAFLYLDAESRPMLLGWADGSALWDVRQALAGATGLRWGW